MYVNLTIGTFTSKSGGSYDCILLHTKSGLEISIVDFKAVQRVKDIISLAASLGVAPDEI